MTNCDLRRRVSQAEHNIQAVAVKDDFTFAAVKHDILVYKRCEIVPAATAQQLACGLFAVRSPEQTRSLLVVLMIIIIYQRFAHFTQR